jgi:hypothetical protein
VVDTRLIVVQNAKHANLRAARNANTCPPGTDPALDPATAENDKKARIRGLFSWPSGSAQPAQRPR